MQVIPPIFTHDQHCEQLAPLLKFVLDQRPELGTDSLDELPTTGVQQPPLHQLAQALSFVCLFLHLLAALLDDVPFDGQEFFQLQLLLRLLSARELDLVLLGLVEQLACDLLVYGLLLHVFVPQDDRAIVSRLTWGVSLPIAPQLKQVLLFHCGFVALTFFLGLVGVVFKLNVRLELAATFRVKGEVYEL